MAPPMGGAPMGAGMPPAGPRPPEGKNVVDLAEVNTTVSMFPAEKKLIFTPQEHSSYTEKLKLYVDVLQQNFMIDSINHLSEGVFEIVFDPRESFQSVIEFLSPQPNVQQG